MRRHEWVAADSARVPCSWHHFGDEGLLTFWPAEYTQWAKAQGFDQPIASHARVATNAPRDGTSVIREAREAPALSIVSPPAGATYLLDPTLRREFQTLPLRVVAQTHGPIEWTVSGRNVGAAASDDTIDWPLAPGLHRIVARDRDGHIAEATVTVK